MSARATEQAKDDLISAIHVWAITPHADTDTCLNRWDEVLAKVAGLIEAAKTVEPSAELAGVLADISRTAAVVEATKPTTSVWEGSPCYLGGDSSMHKLALEELRHLLAREIDLRQAVAP